MKLLRAKRLYLPALTIIAAVLLLLVLISVSTIRNLDREKSMQMDFIRHRGVTLMRALEAGARAGMSMPMWGEDAIARLIQEAGRDEDIAYIYLVNDSGIVEHHSQPSLNGSRSAWRPKIDLDYEVKVSLRTLSDGTQVFDMAQRFAPEPLHPVMARQHRRDPHRHDNIVIVIGLSMETFAAARRADLHHALLMAAIVVALGSGAFFFIFVIQNYYLVGKTLAQTQDYMRQVVANMADGLLSLNAKGKIVSYNQLALDLLGLKESGIPKLDLSTVLDFDTAGITDTLSDCRAVYDREVNYRLNSRKAVSLSFSVTPMEVRDGRCNGAVVVIRDLSKIKALEEKVRRAEKLAALGKLAASVAHEIRNPLSSIKGFAQLFQQQFEADAPEREYAGIMVKEVDRINAVVNDLLTFARPVKATPAATDVAALIDHSVRLIDADAKALNVSVDHRTAPGLTGVLLDPHQMTQALLNLLLNALHAVQANGCIEVEATLDTTEHDVLIRVMDDGAGIAANSLDKIFDPFFTTREKGTGLGLAMVYRIVENHGGTIFVQSPPPEKKRGTCFTIRIPKEQ